MSLSSMMNYPIKYPFARLFARLGFTLTVNIDVIYDPEAGVYVATSKDITGLVLEAESFFELTAEVQEAVSTLTQLAWDGKLHASADLVYRDHIAIA